MSQSMFDGIIRKWTSVSPSGEKFSRRRFLSRLSAVAATLAVAGVVRDAFADCLPMNTGCAGPNTCTDNACESTNTCVSLNHCIASNQCPVTNICSNGNTSDCAPGTLNACGSTNTCSGDNTCQYNTCLGADSCDTNTCRYNSCAQNTCTVDDLCYLVNTCTDTDTDCGYFDFSCWNNACCLGG